MVPMIIITLYSVVSADLSGYNRLGNRIYSHVKTNKPQKISILEQIANRSSLSPKRKAEFLEFYRKLQSQNPQVNSSETSEKSSQEKRKMRFKRRLHAIAQINSSLYWFCILLILWIILSLNKWKKAPLKILNKRAYKTNIWVRFFSKI